MGGGSGGTGGERTVPRGRRRCQDTPLSTLLSTPSNTPSHLAPWKFPQAGHRLARRPLGQQHTATVIEQSGRSDQHGLLVGGCGSVWGWGGGFAMPWAPPGRHPPTLSPDAPAAMTVGERPAADTTARAWRGVRTDAAAQSPRTEPDVGVGHWRVGRAGRADRVGQAGADSGAGRRGHAAPSTTTRVGHPAPPPYCLPTRAP